MLQLDYIRKLSKAYVIDNRLYETYMLTGDELAENFHSSVKLIQLNHPTLYQSLLDTTFYEQQKIFKTYFDIYFERYTDLTELTSELEKVIDDNNIITEDAGATGVLAALATTIVEVIKFVGTTFFSIKALVLCLLLFLWPAARRKLSKATLLLIINIFKFFTFIGKTSKEFGDEFTLAYSIIHNNANKCLLKCDYDPKKAGPTDYLYQMEQGNLLRDIGRIFMSIDKEEKLDCIRECYLETLTESVKLAANMYFQCLQNTGDVSRLPFERDFSMYQEIIIKTKINRSCDIFMKTFKDALNAFDTSVELLFSQEPDEQRAKKIDLMDSIYKLQKNYSSSDSRSSKPLDNQQRFKPRPNQSNNQQKPFRPNTNQSNNQQRNY